MKIRRIPLIAISVALFTSAGSLESGPLSEQFSAIHKDSKLKAIDLSPEEIERMASYSYVLTVSEIALERAGCFGTCPVYSVRFTQNGDAFYSGGRHARISGTRRGKITEGQFRSVASFIDNAGFFEMKDYYRYTDMMTDLETTYLSATRDGEQKIIYEYGGAGPKELWIIKALIDKLILETDWDQDE